MLWKANLDAREGHRRVIPESLEELEAALAHAQQHWADPEAAPP